MVNVADTPRSWSDAPFRYIAGHVALDLVNTVDWTAAGLVEDRLNSYERLVEWGVGAKLVSAKTAERLCAHATRRMPGAVRVLRDARALRHAIRRLVLARLGHEAADPSLTTDAALASLSRMVRAASRHHQLAIVRRTGAKRSAPAIDWVWTGLDGAAPPLNLIVWMAAHAAAALVSSASVDRLGVLAQAPCAVGSSWTRPRTVNVAGVKWRPAAHAQGSAAARAVAGTTDAWRKGEQTDDCS